jgi:hypothetical protein
VSLGGITVLPELCFLQVTAIQIIAEKQSKNRILFFMVIYFEMSSFKMSFNSIVTKAVAESDTA